MNRTLRTLIGCIAPVVVLFLLPVLGIDGGLAVFVAVVLVFGCHLLMIRHHKGDGHD